MLNSIVTQRITPVQRIYPNFLKKYEAEGVAKAIKAPA
jgi:hypothetical protein